MRFATRIFIWSFVPFAFLLGASFWAIQAMVQSAVRNELRASLRQTHNSIARLQSKTELQNSRFLAVAGENPALKAGLQLLLSERDSAYARPTVEDQLREICDNLRLDFLMVANNDGKALAGVMRVEKELVALDPKRMRPLDGGLLTLGGTAYHVTSVPVNQSDEQLGLLTLGAVFDFADLTTPGVLTQRGKVIRSSFAGIENQEVERALSTCKDQQECQIVLRGETFLSLPLESVSLGDGYMLRSLQSVDTASQSVLSVLRKVFTASGAGALLAALIVTLISARSVVKPIDHLVRRLKQGEETGLLPELPAQRVPIHEIRELTESFNRAAAAIREARRKLHDAYFEFTTSLASALDARDSYTAGHSRRVSEYSCSIAKALHVEGEALEEIRIGALLHDIGKIGIADAVLQKPGKLTPEEFAIIQRHPVIGKHILEEVQAFGPFLPMVELHHENQDGSGYPWGLAGDQIPLSARIVHVADAYDAMTTNRPYRPAMTHDTATGILRKFAGTQFDRDIVKVFLELPKPEIPEKPDLDALGNLAAALGAAESPVPLHRVEREEPAKREAV